MDTITKQGNHTPLKEYLPTHTYVKCHSFVIKKFLGICSSWQRKWTICFTLHSYLKDKGVTIVNMNPILLCSLITLLPLLQSPWLKEWWNNEFINKHDSSKYHFLIIKIKVTWSNPTRINLMNGWGLQICNVCTV